jgi:hypothetical protein
VLRVQLCRGGRKGMGLTHGPRRSAGGRERGGSAGHCWAAVGRRGSWAARKKRSVACFGERAGEKEKAGLRG